MTQKQNHPIGEPSKAENTPDTISVGDRVRYQFTHVLQTVTCTAAVVRVGEDRVWLRFGPRIMSLPFPPVQRGHLLIVRRDAAVKALVR